MAEKYYAITTSMTFSKTVLVPAKAVKNIEEAIELVDNAVETSDISLLDEEAEFSTKPTWFINPKNKADSKGLHELPDKEANYYKIIGG